MDGNYFEGPILIQHFLRGKADYKGRQSLVFDYQGKIGEGSDRAIHIVGYRVIDVDTGALLYEELLQQSGETMSYRYVIDMDISAWPEEMGVEG